MKLKKMVVGIMSVVMAVSFATVPAFAAGEVPGFVGEQDDGTTLYTSENNEISNATTSVTASVDGQYTLVIPQKIKLTGSDSKSGNKTATLPVTVYGDIGEYERVLVAVDDVVLSSATGADVKATVTAPKKYWNRDDVIANDGNGTTSNYTVSATLTPGSWSGTVTFKCALSVVPPAASTDGN